MRENDLLPFSIIAVTKKKFQLLLHYIGNVTTRAQNSNHVSRLFAGVKILYPTQI